MLAIYKKSYIFVFYNFEVNSDDGIISFFNNSKRTSSLSQRFRIKLYINNQSKEYFQPIAWWNNLYRQSWPQVISPKVLSGMTHGFQTNSAPGTKVFKYTPPFFIIFKSYNVSPNFLQFTDFKKPNAELSILAMISYDEINNLMYPNFQPDLVLPYTNELSLNTVCEFYLYDTNRVPINVSDKSQLYVNITIL